jgi:hypothetical protein
MGRTVPEHRGFAVGEIADGEHRLHPPAERPRIRRGGEQVAECAALVAATGVLMR